MRARHGRSAVLVLVVLVAAGASSEALIESSLVR
jgi:hypothetical protein